MLKVTTVETDSISSLESRVNYWIQTITDQGSEVKDIKYSSTPETKYDCAGYSAMIIYEEKEK